MKYTEKLNLKKPDQEDFYQVDDFNENTDKIEEEIMNRLPLSGGTMTGSITVKETEILHRDVNDSFLSICGGKNWRDGAYTILHGSKADEKGAFNLGAYDGNTEINLIGKPTGELTWGANNIITSAGGTMTGTIKSTLGGTAPTIAYAGDGKFGGHMYFFPITDSNFKGGFLARAIDDSNNSFDLVGKNNGELTWDKKNIVRSVNNIPASADGNVQITTVNNIVIESMPIGKGKTIGELKTALLAWLKRTQGVTAQCMFTADGAWSEHWTDDSYVLKEGSLWTVTSIGNITTHVQAYAHLMFASYASPNVFTATVVESTFTQFKMLGGVNSVNEIEPDENGNVDLPIATAEKYGLVKVATDDDAIKGKSDAAITAATYHDVSDFRHANTAYKVGDKVECMFNFELFLECIQGGTTSGNPLDTRNVTHNQELIDGTVKWVVRTHIKSVNGSVAGADGDIKINSVCVPVGGVLLMYNNTNPAEIYAGTTWELIASDKYLKTTTGTPLSTGGSNSFTIQKANLPAVKVQLESFSVTTQPHTHNLHVMGCTNQGANIHQNAVHTDNEYHGEVDLRSDWNYAKSGGGANTGTASPYTQTLGNGTPISINPEHITIKAWKRLS